MTPYGYSHAVTTASRPRPWVAAAACAGTDPELFFPESLAADTPQVIAAKAICARCPVLLSCLMDAVRDRERGIWGGTTERERSALRNWNRQVAA